MHVPVAPGASFHLPPKLEGLRTLAYNMWWSWHPRARIMFSRIDAGGWARYRNPIPVLSGPVDWSQLLDNPAFMADYHDMLAEFESYMNNGADHWFQRRHARELDGPIAYFCAEYGLHESLGIYSGGLGVLAGDHMKAASDMALPLIGVGLMYRKGYFRQTIDADGHQEHAYPDYELTRLPIRRALDALGEPLTVSVPLPGRELFAAVWVVQVGRVPVLLLDTDVPDNDDSDRPITHILYVRGREMRLHQELVLGVGGVRALRELELEPAAWHLNEGHSAFLLAERARELVAAGETLDDAFSTVRRNSVFTIHTPVAAGNERFDADLVRRVAGPLLDGDGRPSTGGVPVERLLSLGLGVENDASPVRHDRAVPPDDPRRQRGLAAPRADGERDLAGHQPGRDPGHHERRPHADLGRPADARHARAVHPAPTWTRWTTSRPRGASGTASARCPRTTCGRRTSARSWSSRSSPAAGCATSSRATARRRRRSRSSRTSWTRRSSRSGSPAGSRPTSGRPCCSPTSTAWRGLLWDAKRPVQIIFAGKAHPADRPGQGVIQDIFGRSRSPKLRGRVFIVEDYDIRIARFLVQGVDVWLNNPRRPLEASGTSGMKAAANGVRQRVRARRLVGRGLDGQQRLGDRRSRDQPRRGRPGLGRRAGPVPDPGAGADSRLLRPRRAGPARALAGRHAQLDREHDLALLRRRACSTSTSSASTSRRRPPTMRDVAATRGVAAAAR